MEEALVLGPERTLLQDVRFGIEQLVEIAVRSLASGHIDPITAARCVDRLAAAIARVSTRCPPSPHRRDAGGAVRVVQRPLCLADLVTAAFSSIRLHATGNLPVIVRLPETFERLAVLNDRRDLRAALDAEALTVHRAAERALHDPDDRAAARAAYQRVLDARCADAVTADACGAAA